MINETATEIIKGATPGADEKIISAINHLTGTNQANRGAVILACTQVMAQCIASAGPECAVDIRAGMIALMDGFAMQVVVEG